MTFVDDLPDWPRLRWNLERLAEPLADVRHRQGLLLGRTAALGFDLQTEASLSTLTADVVKTSAIRAGLLKTTDGGGRSTCDSIIDS